jgi:hypothetical protein
MINETNGKRKFFTLLLLFIIAPIIGGLYGIIHDQFTYTISPEYYTKFKFNMFEIPEGFPERIRVAMVGWDATWWMGVPIGIILGLTGLIHKDAKTMLYVTLKSFLLVIIIAFLTGLIGLLIGEFSLANKPISTFSDWYIPYGLVDFKNFISVGSMHNFSYLGGAIGLVAGIIYSIRKKIATDRLTTDY